MTDKKISALDPASTPVAGTEVLAIVQSGATKKVSINNLTAGKSVSASDFVATGSITTGKTAVTSPSASDGNIFSGTYTPTGYTGTNVTVVTPSKAQYMRVGNTVTVSGYVTTTCTTASGTLSTFTLDLPVASNFSAASQGAGTAVSISSTASRSTYSQVFSDSPNDRIGFNFNCNYAGVNPFYFTFTYRVI
jgi:hypothetical protein